MNEYNIKHYVVAQKQELESYRTFLSDELKRPVNNYELMHSWISSGKAEAFHKAYMGHLNDMQEETSGLTQITLELEGAYHGR